MAPSSGHQLLPKIWRVARFAFEKATRVVEARVSEQLESSRLAYQPIYARFTHRQAINRIAATRQTQRRFYSTSRSATRLSTQAFQSSKICAAVSRLTTRTPFASTLRPNLTGGTLGRTAGGYTIGAGRLGGARYFSNGPATPAQVVQNVSAGVRAFWLSGQRVRFDGVDPQTGHKNYRVVTALQEETCRKMQAIPRNAPGSYVDLKVSPTIIAFSRLTSAADTVEAVNLNTDNLMNFLSIDFARALKDFAAVLNDLKRLSALGDLPLSLHDQSTLRVQFPGCDAESVERLCDEVGVQRGVIHQDEDFEIQNGSEMALLFPFAPSHMGSEPEFSGRGLRYHKSPDMLNWRHMMSLEELEEPSHFTTGPDYHYVGSNERNPWSYSPTPSGYSSMNISELGDRAFFPDLTESANGGGDPSHYGGF
ncbi:casein kinase II beta 2 subunit [Paracoccidioides lutzii Pb01]|uniref:Casein kinase II beta 2 subunit n=1 Tax=Paracoccidioides lutzii (strain ATCC MYA-826 / Pb01) TaxID=502779 RepID=C1GWD5_PARBA|nr:casein kinase II beta 2 subunit [Paracoccidioides lutzii Pb01]EEH40854.1 casein kinase II beta 2 subunit [Paracoccidioides lutzii Pb01]